MIYFKFQSVEKLIAYNSSTTHFKQQNNVIDVQLSIISREKSIEGITLSHH